MSESVTTSAPIIDVGPVKMVPIEEIRSDSDIFRLTTGDPPEDLIKSIREWGCFCPPVCACREGRLVPVAGFKRLSVLTALRSPGETIEVRELPEDTGTLRVLSVAAADTLRERPLNPFEIARGIRIAISSGHTQATIAKHLLPHFGVEPHETVVKRHLTLLRVEPDIAAYLEEKGVTLKRSLEFVRVPSDGAALLVELAAMLNLSARALEEWARMIGDIAQRDLRSWLETASQSGLLDLARDPDLTVADRARHCGRLLRKLRYPIWAQALATTRMRVRKLELPERVRVKWDETFESEGMALEIQVRTADELEQDVARLTERHSIKQLADLLDSL